MVTNILLFYISNFIATYVIKCHVINKNIEDFRKIAAKHGLPEKIERYMEESLDEKPKWYDYIPLVNVALSIGDWILRKEVLKELEKEVKSFDSEEPPVIYYPSNQENMSQGKEYYVGYFLDGRAIVVYFMYDGKDGLAISNDSAKTFMAFESKDKVETLLHILYQIYIGSKEYIRCENIEEVFTPHMIKILEVMFESKDINVVIEEDLTRDLTRCKPK